MGKNMQDTFQFAFGTQLAQQVAQTKLKCALHYLIKLILWIQVKWNQVVVIFLLQAAVMRVKMGIKMVIHNISAQ